MLQNKYGTTVFHDAARNAESLKTILALLPKNQRLEVVMVQDKDGTTVLDRAARNAESLKIILELLPVNQRLEVVMTQDKDDNTVLHYVASSPAIQKIIRELLPAKTDYNSENMQPTVLSSNKNISRASQNRHSFFLTAKENNTDKDVLHNPAPIKEIDSLSEACVNLSYN
ncbi:hypothetical protein Lsan_3166 [Legionella santicrucis]|uniref:Uncharacterized protein n=1 Tax=Legionella santicrucis TaxID=45074 RepID=A0A0W0YGF1_9GAMM|nr:ankyrin repeat domain-containing protein [Legionella santicrucis]KTD55614.1 hypothetical protein Lsan_3166 [Legionella santicrucis]